MTYTVKFRDDALKEWLRLDKTIQQQFAKKLKKCSENNTLYRILALSRNGCHYFDVYVFIMLRTI